MMLLLAFLITLFAYITAYTVACAIETSKARAVDTTVVALLLTVFHITVVTMVCGILIRNMSPQVIGAVSVCINLLILIPFGFDKVGRELNSITSRARALLRQVLKDRFILFLLLLFLTQQIITVSRITLAPPNEFDSQVYHLPISISWLQQSHMPFSGDVPVGRLNYATKLPKMLNYWFLSLSGGLQFIELSQYFGYALLLLVSFALLRSLAVNRRWALIGMLAISSIPIVVIENHTLQDHMLLAALHLTVVKIIFDIVDGKVKKTYELLLFGIGTALLLASKFSAPAHIISIFGVFGLLYGKTWVQKMRHIQKRTLFASLLIILSIGVSWYLANHFYYGSPFGPKPGQSSQENIFVKNVFEFPIKIFDFQHRYTPDLIGISGFGLQVATFGLLTALFAVISNFRNKKVFGLFFSTIIVTFMYFALYYTLYNYRLLIFLPTVVLILSIYYISQSTSSVLKKCVLLLIPLGMAYAMVTTVYTDYVKHPLYTFKELTRLYPQDRTAVRFDYASDKFRNDSSWLFIDQYIPDDNPILYITQNEGPGYDDNILAAYYGNSLRRRAYWGGSITNSPLITPDGKPTSLLETFMRNKNIHFLHNNSVFFYEPTQLRMEGTNFVRITDRLYYLP